MNNNLYLGYKRFVENVVVDVDYDPLRQEPHHIYKREFSDHLVHLPHLDYDYKHFLLFNPIVLDPEKSNFVVVAEWASGVYDKLQDRHYADVVFTHTELSYCEELIRKLRNNYLLFDGNKVERAVFKLGQEEYELFVPFANKPSWAVDLTILETVVKDKPKPELKTLGG